MDQRDLQVDDTPPEPSAIERAVEAAGNQSKLADDLGVSPQAVQQWVSSGTVPPRRVLDIERLTGISRHELRPDIYGAPPGALASGQTAKAAAS